MLCVVLLEMRIIALVEAGSPDVFVPRICSI
jgi:hypothetical protein